MERRQGGRTENKTCPRANVSTTKPHVGRTGIEPVPSVMDWQLTSPVMD